MLLLRLSTGGVIESRGDGRMVSEIPRQIEQGDARILFDPSVQSVNRLVRAAIVDQDEFDQSAEAVHERGEPVAQ